MRVMFGFSKTGVALRGIRERKLVVSSPKSVEPMAVSLPLKDIRQVAVLSPEPTDTEKRFTVAAQVSAERWVRLGVMESALDAEELIRDCARAISGSRVGIVFALMAASTVMAVVLLTALMFVTGGYDTEVYANDVPAAETAVDPASASEAQAAASEPAPTQAAPAAPAAPSLNKAQQGAINDYFSK